MAQVVAVVGVDPYPAIIKSETGEPYLLRQVVDVSEDCPNRTDNAAVLLLYRSMKGEVRIVQIMRPYVSDPHQGMWVFFFMDQLEAELYASVKNDIFGHIAMQLGLAEDRYDAKVRLIALIKANVPS